MNDLSVKEESGLISEKEMEQLDDLRRFRQRVTKFLSDVQEHHWAMSFDTFDGHRKIEFEPIFVGRFLQNYLWSQGHKILCASATIPPSFVEEAGLGNYDVGRVEVPSTFPPDRRPIITTESVGKMSYNERDSTLPKMADQITNIADIWQGHKGFVHCHSYSIATDIYYKLPPRVRERTYLQDDDNREESLQDWRGLDATVVGETTDSGGQIFLSVAMDEGISLDHDAARWQVVAKAAYPHMQDERVSYRMNEDTMDGTDWTWYASQAAINLQQAVGRGMRARDDWCATYLLDDSLLTLLDRNEYLFEDWFLEAVDCDFDTDVVAPSNT
jgi:Rad3-related DNA helicase